MINKPINAPFGTWESSISAALVAQGSDKIAEPKIHGSDVYCLQSLANEKARMTIMRFRLGSSSSILAAPYNVRSKVHEYGGHCYCISDSELYFVNASDQQIYCIDLELSSSKPKQISAIDNWRFADLSWDSLHSRILAVAEIHEEDHSVRNCIVSMDCNGALDILHEGHDFYAYPRLDANSTFLSWIHWDHPNMPWDDTCLGVACYHGTHINAEISIRAGGKAPASADTGESIVQPLWSPSGDLYFVSDKNNWWNLYGVSRADIDFALKADTRPTDITATPVLEKEAEFATPLWTLGMANYGFLDANTILASYTENGFWKLCTIDLASGKSDSIDNELCRFESVNCQDGRAVFIGASEFSGSAVYSYSHQGAGLDSEIIALTEAFSAQVDQLSRPMPMRFASGNNKEHAHAFYYPPSNEQFMAKGKPPLIVLCHGGPTGQNDSALELKIQFWTSRGFSVMDVNYRGSTGYGREYRRSLYKHWGEKDVEDMTAAVAFLIEKQLVDEDKIVIKGSSAGGFTVLAALTFTDRFNAGVSLYGIGDLELLAQDTHKFEAHYLDQLIGPYPESKALYLQRSPIHSTEKLNCAMLLFQGLEDKVVPPAQASAMAAAVDAKSLPYAHVEFADEGHGFRNPSNIEAMLEAELYFYQKVFRLKSNAITETDDGPAPLKINNLNA